jgi:hypothetical protein
MTLGGVNRNVPGCECAGMRVSEYASGRVTSVQIREGTSGPGARLAGELATSSRTLLPQHYSFRIQREDVAQLYSSVQIPSSQELQIFLPITDPFSVESTPLLSMKRI